MEDKYKRKRNIPDILMAIDETDDILDTIRYENQIACMFASPIAFFGAIANFVFSYLVLNRNISSTLFDSLIPLTLGILFEFLLRVRINVKLASYAISILFSLWFLFILARHYNMVGPAIWMVACIQIVFAMSRIKKDMAIIIGVVTLLTSIYVLFNPSDFQFRLNYFYFILQTVLLAIFIIVFSVAHTINSKRYFKLRHKLQLEVEQKNNIAVLYQENAGAEEELRKQNEQLIIYTEEIKKTDKRLYELAYFDSLTGLPNRKMFVEQLTLLIEKSKEQNSIFYVVFLDADSFKKVNDIMGHDVGDKFICFFADRLKEYIHEGDLLGRTGGDSFALVILRDLNKDEVLKEIETIRNSFEQPFIMENKEVLLTSSFGVSVFPQDGSSATEMIKNADMAMYKAKELGKNNVQFFKKYMLDEIIQKSEMENRLINALKNNEFFLVFQPQYSVDSKKVRGLEALVRWKSPELGIINPAQFIPLAEETQHIIPIGEWILRTACNTFKRLQEKYGLDALVSVNISTIQIRDSKFVELVKKVLDETGLRPEYLELEITESIIIESFNQAIDILRELKNLGIRIALDDFGTGYSSLSYLKLLPIDTLKIDKSFIDDLSPDDSKIQIVGDIISLGHNLGVAIVAEGVEYAYQLQYLKNHFCDYIQGYLLGKPLCEEVLNKSFPSAGNNQKPLS